MSKHHFSKIGLGTGSAIKISAVTRVFGGGANSPPTEIVPVHDAPSGVSDQPIGHQETRQGAYNRARAAQKAKPQCDAYIGIENGMWKKFDSSRDGDAEDDGISSERGQWVDAAYVVMIVPAKVGEIDNVKDDLVIQAVSDTIDIPPVGKRPFPTGKRGEWSVLKDPHSVLTDGRKSREEFLVEALERLKAILA